MTDAERWVAVKALVGDALDLTPEARAAWLAAQDVSEDLREEAAALLDADARAGPFLARAAIFETAAAGAVHDATRAAAAPAIGPGQRLGAYRVERVIGEGGMGTVYLATRADDAFDKQVAIKLVRAGLAGPGLVERLREERRVLASLDHPNIARLLDGGATDDGVPYVVMEYVDGLPLDAYCESRGTTVAGRVALVRHVCDAVHDAHRNLIVHRDIKPGNVLVTAAGTPKLLDFGIAKVLGGVAASRSQTVGAMTPDSASPEQVTGGAITVGTDVYGLGLLLYRLLAGRGPFDTAGSAAALLRAVCEDDPVPPSRLAPGSLIPADLDRIVLKALAKRPQDRYDTAAALSDDLGRLLDRRPVKATPDSLAYRSRRFVARHRLGTAVAATGIIVLLAGVVATAWQAGIARRERARAEQRFDDLRRLANTLIFRIHDAVSELPGSTPVRQTIVESAVVYLDTLAREATDDLPLQRELAAAYERLASVQGRSGAANLGDVAGARVNLDKALALRRAIASPPRATPVDTVALATTLERLANLPATPETRSALALEGLALLDALPAADAATLGARAARAALVWNDAVSRADRKDYAAAAERYQQAASLFEQLMLADPAGAVARGRSLAIAYRNIGSVRWMLDDRPAAIEAYRQALALDESRLATQPDNTTWRLDLSYSVSSIAFAELETGATAAAVAHYERALDLRQQALTADPQNDQAQDGVMRAQRALARALGLQGQERRALDASAAAVRMAEVRLQSRPDAGRAAALVESLLAEVRLRRHFAARTPAHVQAACLAFDRIEVVRRQAVAAGATRAPGPGEAELAGERGSCPAPPRGR